MSVVIGDGRTMICTREEVESLIKRMKSVINSHAELIDESTEDRKITHFGKMITPIGEIADILTNKYTGEHHSCIWSVAYNDDIIIPKGDTFMVSYCTYLKTISLDNHCRFFAHPYYFAVITPLSLFGGNPLFSSTYMRGFKPEQMVENNIDMLKKRSFDEDDWDNWHGYGDYACGSGKAAMIIGKSSLEKYKFDIAKLVEEYNPDEFLDKINNVLNCEQSLYVITCNTHEWHDEDNDYSTDIEFDIESYDPTKTYNNRMYFVDE